MNENNIVTNPIDTSAFPDLPITTKVDGIDQGTMKYQDVKLTEFKDPQVPQYARAARFDLNSELARIESNQKGGSGTNKSLNDLASLAFPNKNKLDLTTTVDIRDTHEVLSNGTTWIPKYKNYLPGVDNDTRLAMQQTDTEKFLNPIKRFVANTSKAPLDLIGSVYGIGAAAFSGRFDAIYDNDYMHWVDDWTLQTNNTYKNYYTEAQRDQNLGLNLQTFDKVLGGAEFTSRLLAAEAILAVATGGTSLTATAAKTALSAGAKISNVTAKGSAMAKALKFLRMPELITAAKVETSATRAATSLLKESENIAGSVASNTSRLNKAAQRGQIADALVKTRFAVTSPLYEAGFEARHFEKEAKDQFWNFYREKGVEPTVDEINAFSDNLSGSANGVFALNMGILAPSNLAMMGNVLDLSNPFARAITSSGKGVSERLFGMGVTKAADGTFRALKPTLTQKVAAYIAPVIKGGLTEGVYEEGGQGIASSTFKNYVASSYNPKYAKTTANYIDAFGTAFADQFGTKAGREEMIIGALIGGLFGIGGAVRGGNSISNQYKKQERTAEVQNLGKEFIDGFKSDAYTNEWNLSLFSQGNRFQQIQENLNKAEQSGDKLAQAQTKAQSFMSMIEAYHSVGKEQVFVDNMSSTIVGLDPKMIADSTGLSLEEVQDYKNEQIQNIEEMSTNYGKALKAGRYIFGNKLSSTVRVGDKDTMVSGELMANALAFSSTMANFNERFAMQSYDAIQTKILETAGGRELSERIGAVFALKSMSEVEKQQYYNLNGQSNTYKSEITKLTNQISKLQGGEQTEASVAKILELGKLLGDAQTNLLGVNEKADALFRASTENFYGKMGKTGFGTRIELDNFSDIVEELNKDIKNLKLDSSDQIMIEKLFEQFNKANDAHKSFLEMSNNIQSKEFTPKYFRGMFGGLRAKFHEKSINEHTKTTLEQLFEANQSEEFAKNARKVYTKNEITDNKLDDEYKATKEDYQTIVDKLGKEDLNENEQKFYDKFKEEIDLQKEESDAQVSDPKSSKSDKIDISQKYIDRTVAEKELEDLQNGEYSEEVQGKIDALQTKISDLESKIDEIENSTIDNSLNDSQINDSSNQQDSEIEQSISNGDKIIKVNTKPLTNEIQDTKEDIFITADKNPEGRIHINMESLKDILIVPNNNLIIIDKTTGKEIVNQELNKEGGVIFEAMQGRLFVVANINGQNVPFYKSSAGTSGKTQGEWYPFFGYTGAWLVKGSVNKTTGKMNYSSEIDRITNLLNENLIFPDKYIDRSTNTISDKNGKVLVDMNDYFKINRLWQKEFNSQTGDNTNYKVKGLKENTRSESSLVALITGLNTTQVDSSTPNEVYEWIDLINKNIENSVKKSDNSSSNKQDSEIETLNQEIENLEKEIENLETSKEEFEARKKRTVEVRKQNYRQYEYTNKKGEVLIGWIETRTNGKLFFTTENDAFYIGEKRSTVISNVENLKEIGEEDIILEGKEIYVNGKLYNIPNGNIDENISKDENGNYEVKVKAKNGRMVTLKGNVADTIVYENLLNKIETDEQAREATSRSERDGKIEKKYEELDSKTEDRDSRIQKIEKDRVKAEKERLTEEDRIQSEKEKETSDIYDEIEDLENQKDDVIIDRQVELEDKLAELEGEIDFNEKITRLKDQVKELRKEQLNSFSMTLSLKKSAENDTVEQKIESNEDSKMLGKMITKLELEITKLERERKETPFNENGTPSEQLDWIVKNIPEMNFGTVDEASNFTEPSQEDVNEYRDLIDTKNRNSTKNKRMAELREKLSPWFIADGLSLDGINILDVIELYNQSKNMKDIADTQDIVTTQEELTSSINKVDMSNDPNAKNSENVSLTYDGVYMSKHKDGFKVSHLKLSTMLLASLQEGQTPVVEVFEKDEKGKKKLIFDVEVTYSNYLEVSQQFDNKNGIEVKLSEDVKLKKGESDSAFILTSPLNDFVDMMKFPVFKIKGQSTGYNLMYEKQSDGTYAPKESEYQVVRDGNELPFNKEVTNSLKAGDTVILEFDPLDEYNKTLDKKEYADKANIYVKKNGELVQILKASDRVKADAKSDLKAIRAKVVKGKPIKVEIKDSYLGLPIIILDNNMNAIEIPLDETNVLGYGYVDENGDLQGDIAGLDIDNKQYALPQSKGKKAPMVAFKSNGKTIVFPINLKPQGIDLSGDVDVIMNDDSISKQQKMLRINSMLEEHGMFTPQTALTNINFDVNSVKQALTTVYESIDITDSSQIKAADKTAYINLKDPFMNSKLLLDLSKETKDSLDVSGSATQVTVKQTVKSKDKSGLASAVGKLC